jgi:hypothetical protein
LPIFAPRSLGSCRPTWRGKRRHTWYGSLDPIWGAFGVIPDHWSEDFSRRFHGWEGYNYEWKDDKVAWTDIGWSAWAIGPVGTRGGGMADPKSVGNGIKYCRDEWSKIAADQRDAMMNLLLEDPTGVQQVSDESRLFILDTAADGIMTAWRRPSACSSRRSALS